MGVILMFFGIRVKDQSDPRQSSNYVGLFGIHFLSGPHGHLYCRWEFYLVEKS
jgi:hypothetical protein